PPVFTVLRAVPDLFSSQAAARLGLSGAFGSDIAFQFDAITLKLTRPSDQRAMVLYLPAALLVVAHYAATAWVDRYDFE
ncbi:anthranilate synthase component I, partial [Rhizobium ruizarguesonis]